MQTISTKELRDKLSEILERVAIGRETFVIKKFGKVKAMITPVVKEEKFDKLPAFGIWKNHKGMKDSATYVRKLREKESFRVREKK